jgi:hypothetical protein
MKKVFISFIHVVHSFEFKQIQDIRLFKEHLILWVLIMMEKSVWNN